MATLPAPLRRLLLRTLRATVAARRPPDKIIGGEDDPYIRRWHVIPRNHWFNLYLHNQVRSDDDRALHDHPWPNISLVLEGGYLEHRPAFPGQWPHNRKIEAVYRPAGSIVARPANAAHRLELLARAFGGDKTVLQHSWSLFITGPVRRPWGFWCPQGWVFWQDFSDPTGLKPGKGCGEDAPIGVPAADMKVVEEYRSDLFPGSRRFVRQQTTDRVTELLEANNREVERRREAERIVRFLLLNTRLDDLDSACVEEIRRQYGSA
ncbi:hypothetical protein [Oceanibaculum indicum]|uniref:Uncharacterized protein n=1 Tax=Oceanibaculum indicum P24 TaxID=1207063 RepID=K2JDV0_9PROT|nr:hypothetical protein [Oceanibaculum indicum]EKE68724.1 hypothetical protein P24_17322 [Oceanibaculum indicum P24]